MDTDAPLQLHLGQVLARDYRVVRALAAGGMGSVYLVEQLSTGKQRALKVMHPQYARSEESRQRFAQEAKAGARIKSEHVVEVVAAGIDDETGIPWLAMELLDGEELSARMRRAGRLPPGEVLEIFRQLGHGLGEAHRLGLVHRDLKPENLFVAVARRESAPFTLKILDFGVAKLMQENQAQTEGTRPVGTPRWMAPEQSEERAHIAPSTDVWAMGLLAYYLLTGRYYWNAANGGGSLTMLLRELVLEPIDAPSSRAAAVGLGAAIPAGFDGWFARCVVREAASRFPDATAALKALIPLLENSPPWQAVAVPVVGRAAQPEERAHDDSGDSATAAPRSHDAEWAGQTANTPVNDDTGRHSPAATRPARPSSVPGLAAMTGPGPQGSTSPRGAHGSTSPQGGHGNTSPQGAQGRTGERPRESSTGPQQRPDSASPFDRSTASQPGAEISSAAARPPPERSRAPWSPARTLVILAALLLLLGSGALVFRARSKPPAPAAPTAGPISVEPASTNTPPVDTFPILFESLPSGADVYEADSKLGTTPLQMTLDNGPLADKPRSFRIVKEGYQPYSMVQGPSHEAVKILATLGELPKPPPEEPVKPKPVHHRETDPADAPELRLRR